MKQFSHVLFVLFFAINLNGQIELQFQHLPPSQEKLSNEVTKIVQDKSGFIWVAVWSDGLYRYDGYEYTKCPELKGSIELYIDNEDNLWVGSEKGLSRYIAETATFESIPIPIPKEQTAGFHQAMSKFYSVIAIDQDKDGNFWLGTAGGGIYFFNPTSKELKPYRYKGGTKEDDIWVNMIRKIHVDEQGNVWGDAQAGGLLKLDPKTGEFTMLHFNPQDPRSWKTNGIYEDEEGILWVGTFNGIYKLNPTTHETEHLPLTGARVNYIHKGKDGQLWIGTHKGILIYNTKTNTYQHFKNDPTNPNSISDYPIFHFFEDQRGDYWVSTLGGGGVHFLDCTTPKFEKKENISIPKTDPKDPYRLSFIHTIYEDKDSVLWIGGKQVKTEDYFSPPLISINQKNNTKDTYIFDSNNPQSLSDFFVSTIFEDHENTLWIGASGTMGGLNRINKKTGEIKHYFPIPDPQNQREMLQNCVLTIFEDSKHNLWVKWYGGIYQFDKKNEKFTAYPQAIEDSLSFAQYVPEINRIGFTPWGNIGFFSVDSLHLTGNPPLSINEDEQGNIWLGTPMGLSKIDHKTNTYQHAWPDPSTFPNGYDGVLKITKTPENNFRLYTQSSIILFNPQTNQIINEHKIIPNIDKDGIYTIATFEDDLGRFWFSSPARFFKLTRYNPTTGQVKKFGKKEGLPKGVTVHENPSDFFKPSESGNRFFSTEHSNEIYYFNPNAIKESTHIPPVVFTSFIRYNSEEELGDPIVDSLILGRDSVELTYQDNILNFKFASLNYNNSQENQYAYLIEGFNEKLD